MLVPRAFQYASASPMHEFDEKNGRRKVQRKTSPGPPKRLLVRSELPARTPTDPVLSATQPVSVPKPERTQSAGPQDMPTVDGWRRNHDSRKPSVHDPSALPPAVAALLAVTQIPRPKPNRFRRQLANARRISIDELVNEWKSDETLSSSYGSSPVLSVLLEDSEAQEEQCSTPKGSTTEDGYLHTRSTSADSVPSLEEDDRSLLSIGSLSTPESMRSRRSSSNLRKDKSRSLPTTEDCVANHPLASTPLGDEDPDDYFVFPTSSGSRPTTPRPKTSFKSNLTTSLQALKNAAMSSLSSFSLSSVSSQSQRTPGSPMSDEMLWSHPFLFPRFSPEVRPAIEGTPTKAQRRYLNPLPLTFEEQEAPYQLALHAPYLAEPIEGAPTILMQTYSRGRRKSASRRASPEPQSEAGRALLSAVGVRQREPRENSDFLRVVVLEMNMRREGKLESGRAKIWLPPRRVSVSPDRAGDVPSRWVGVSAY